MSPELGTIVAVIVITVAWERWDAWRGVDEELAQRQGRYGWRLLELCGCALVLLVVGLVLDAVGVPGAGAVALAAIAGLVFLVYVAPWFAPRRRRR